MSSSVAVAGGNDILPQSQEKSILVTHKWEDVSNSSKIYGSKNKGLSPSAQYLIHDQVVQLYLPVEEVQPLGLQACTHTHKAQGAWAQICRISLCLISPSECLWTRLCLGCDWHCTWTLVTARPPWLLPERESIEMNKRTHHRFLLSFAYTVFSWVWEGVSLFSI